MTSEPENEEGELEMEGFTDSEYVDCEKSRVIAPRGWGWAADNLDATLFRVDYKTGNVEMLQSEYDDGKLISQQWKGVEVKARGRVTAIRGDK